MIPIRHEHRDYYNHLHAYERCVFCYAHTDTWHVRSNKAVCKLCAKKHTVADIPKAWPKECSK